MLIGGIDEAGRGPIIGPLIVAGVCMRNEDVDAIVRLGVKDSKKLTPTTRLRLLPEILSRAQRIVVECIPPSLIDKYTSSSIRGGLNTLEAMIIALIISKLNAKTIFIDTPDIKPQRFKEVILSILRNDYNIDNVDIVVSHHADVQFPIVSIASVIAKVFRDSFIHELHSFYGDFGSGYPSDKKTLSFIEKCLRKGSLPPIIRSKWSTLKKFKKTSSLTLDDFLR
ncbi:MAG: ribonuclease HII [Thermoprotei archaeon]|nr:MAG: ribonuclease HII [Thermoprotei archaeon]RLF19732.1 MAG: ribonuclease HII [Thermoprotei archaeon]